MQESGVRNCRAVPCRVERGIFSQGRQLARYQPRQKEFSEGGMQELARGYLFAFAKRSCLMHEEESADHSLCYSEWSTKSGPMGRARVEQRRKVGVQLIGSNPLMVPIEHGESGDRQSL